MFLFCFACANTRSAEKQRARALENLGNALIREGNLRAGLQRLLEASRLDPENPDLHHELALTYRDLREYELSLKHFKRSLSLRPDAPEVQNNLATLYLLLGQWDQAIESCQKSLDNILYKTPYFAYNNMGLAYFEKGNYPKAIASFNQALLSEPSYGPGYINLGRAYEAIDRWEKAIEAYKRALYYEPNYANAHLNLGRLFLKLSRYEEATHELSRVIESDPGGIYADQARALLKKHQLPAK